MRNTSIFLMILAVVLLLLLSSCTPAPCDVHVDADEDSICDVCKEAICPHIDLNGDELCDFCGAELEHLTCVDKDSDGVCDKCEECLEHVDANDDLVCDRDNCKAAISHDTCYDKNDNNICDACDACIYHAKDDAMDLTCDICGKQYTLTTISEALAEAAKLAHDQTSVGRYYIMATVKSVTSSMYGAMILEDETGTISVYRTESANGTLYSDMDSKPTKGDKILVAGTLKRYNESLEISDARLIAYEDVELDLSKYDEMTLSEARDAEKGTLIKTTGTVARIAYSNGMNPHGFILVDGNSSIYIYDPAIAGEVSVGNAITIAGSKDYWISDKEINHAIKFGYNGCNQLTDCYLLSNAGGNTLDLSFAESTTVKDIINTPITTDISGVIYKVNALVVKRLEPGYTNYYIYDIDGETGSYVYTQCNGSDFAWLDEFDGKICTVYLTAQNAKSTPAGCIWRFLPIDVSYDNYTFDLAGVNDFVLNYHALPQFLARYNTSPRTDFITSLDSVLLGFEGAVISYTSDNESVISFNIVDGVAKLICNAYGTANITVTVSYNGESKSETITVEYAEPSVDDIITVKDAAASENGTEVVIGGVVIGSTINQAGGVYLLDETGAMATLFTSADILKQFNIGDYLIIKGTKDVRNGGGTTYYGQTNIKDATIIANLGAKDYPSNPISDKTIKELHDLNVLEDHTTDLYLVEGTVSKNVGANSITYSLIGDSSKLDLYSGNQHQFAFLDDYIGETVQFEVMIVNWNKKTYYRGCVVSVVVDGVRVVVNDFNFPD